MGGPVFATKWDFFFATVLIGVDRTTGVFSGSEPTPGQQMVAVWTSEAIATEALHVESWELRQITIRELLRVLPDGIGVAVDPEHPSGMTASSSYIAQLKRYRTAFPAGTQVRLDGWGSMADGVRDELVRSASADERVLEVHAFTYAVDDSPLLGCLALVVAPDADAGAVASTIDEALTAGAGSAGTGLPVVHVIALDEVPDEVRAALGDAHVLYRRRRRTGFWRR